MCTGHRDQKIESILFVATFLEKENCILCLYNCKTKREKNRFAKLSVFIIIIRVDVSFSLAILAAKGRFYFIPAGVRNAET